MKSWQEDAINRPFHADRRTQWHHSLGATPWPGFRFRRQGETPRLSFEMERPKRTLGRLPRQMQVIARNFARQRKRQFPDARRATGLPGRIQIRPISQYHHQPHRLPAVSRLSLQPSHRHLLRARMREGDPGLTRHRGETTPNPVDRVRLAPDGADQVSHARSVTYSQPRRAPPEANRIRKDDFLSYSVVSSQSVLPPALCSALTQDLL